jgi:hypothetical protein
VCPGDPVRVAGKQGLWRFIAVTRNLVELVGAYSPTGDPHRSQEISRFFELVDIRPAGKGITRDHVAPNPEMRTWRR